MQYYNIMKAYRVVNNFTCKRRDEALGPQYIGVADCRPTNCSTYTLLTIISIVFSLQLCKEHSESGLMLITLWSLNLNYSD